MAEDVRFVDLLFEQETNGREEFKKMIHSVFKVSASICHVPNAARRHGLSLQSVLQLCSML